ncbi:response regulator transcription factor [Enterobacter ludwigii]|jgi:DNA-binding NarL/FixJ family response regulator|uniref:response regulator transcription factor n=1 Tax=Enterobacter ludwigii TaxID=299767 RepID=UPI0021C6853C|nr:response regulator transcription factor [Enterobacter ludwigii]MCU2397636.1 response regulator transcription factor [Enterobacter ludwigii]MED5737428.1 response regulator transcription factor [Enterobacter ludwigii]HDR2552275.1 response regulator transcription factor [Enterobacter ludwigii]HDR2556132.1 response regulator transcription factor [Enterobacter ludwigii]HDR2570581.1 response regulator transcription factor [Enterobacter ludwigii]
MRVIMFDRQSLFIHGAIHSLQKLIPEINITGSCQAEDLWAQISASPTAIVMIDGNLIEDEGIAWLEAIMQRFPTIRVVMVLAKKEARWVEQLLQRNVMAIVPRNAHPDRFSAVLDSVSRGMVCFPGEWVRQPSAPQALLSLSERQREVLKLLAAGESNKEIGRNLNISAATVKAHLEALFRRLEVKNRTQAAMYYTRATA